MILSDESFDIVIIGTSPDTHIPLACRVLEEESTGILLIEKPLWTPSLDGLNRFFKTKKRKKNIFVGVGYNYILTKAIQLAKQVIKKGVIGKPLVMYTYC